MRFARAVWNYAKNELETPGLPDRNPFRSGKLFHKERARETGMGADDLSRWWSDLLKLENPIRREMHLFMLLSGLRKNDVLTARWSNLDEERRALRVDSSEHLEACRKRAWMNHRVDRALASDYPDAVLRNLLDRPERHV